MTKVVRHHCCLDRSAPRRSLWRAAPARRKSTLDPARCRNRDRHSGIAERARQRSPRRFELPAHQRQLRTDPLLSERPDQSRQRRPSSSRLDFPDRSEGVARDVADRRQRGDVCHHVVQPRLRARRQDRRPDLALQAQARPGHDLLLRPEQSRRRGLRRQGLSRHARRQAHRARRQDRLSRLGAADRRSRKGLQRDDGADCGRRQDPDRHQRRRIRHSRLRAGL